MDTIIVDTDVHLRPNPELALYLAASGSNSSGASPLPWHAAEDNYGYGQSSRELYQPSNPFDLGWSEEEADRYFVASHPLVDNEMDLGLSDHSYTTDTGSGSSSNQPAEPPLLPHDHTGLTMEHPWHNFPLYNVRDREDTLPPIGPAHTSSTGLQLSESDISLYPVSSMNSPFLGSSGPSLLHSHQRPQNTNMLHPAPELFPMLYSPLSSPIPSPRVLSPNDERFVSLEDLNPPYVPGVQHDEADVDMRDDEPVEETPEKSRARSTRSQNNQSMQYQTVKEQESGSTRSPDMTVFPDMSTALSKHRRSTSPVSESPITNDEVSLPEKRPQRKVALRKKESYADSDSGGDSSDGYLPSRSASPYASPSDYSRSPSPIRHPPAKSVRGASKTKNLTKLSAAEALALLAKDKVKPENEVMASADQDWETYDAFGQAKRKNGTIPLPVPVPHLNKKSRGRKVPYVDARTARGIPGNDGLAAGGSGSRGIGSRRGRGGRRGAEGGRSFVCTVPGCGKCFVRGEHLKRHIRSIHTYDKPHRCPYEGCDKSFSRRDNLGQHVRLHLSESP